jgi:hypothetical protein
MYRRLEPTIFRSANLSELFRETYNKINSKIDGETEDYILNVNETEYVNHLSTNYKIDFPEVLFNDAFVDSYETDVSASSFPSTYHVRSGEKYRKTIIQYYIPVLGNISLLNYRPVSSFTISGSGRFVTREQNLLIEFVFFSNNEELKKLIEREVNDIHSNLRGLIKDFEEFNDSLQYHIRTVFGLRKQRILDNKSLLASLGIPLKCKATTSETFAIPQPLLREKIIIKKPIVSEVGYTPEPTLDSENYLKILKIINDVGKNFERMPSTFKDKGEEDLRDHIILVLDPNFELGGVSGETFNKTGKTDILLRYDSTVVFIAECKFWGGDKMYLRTIDQLLKYLSWRDTKTSVVIFVREKNFSSILEKVQVVTETHSNYLGFVSKSDENWFNYRFHLNEDKNREVKLAVQLYHLPKS